MTGCWVQVELLVQSPPLFATLVQMLQECTMDESTLFETMKARVASSGIQITPSQFSEILEKTLEILEMFMGVTYLSHSENRSNTCNQ